MKKSAEALLKKMSEDKDFAEKILSQTEREKVIEIAGGEGIELASEDIDEANEAISKALQTKKEGELSEEELENVAGGFIFEATVASAAIVSGVVLTAGLAASIVASLVDGYMKSQKKSDGVPPEE